MNLTDLADQRLGDWSALSRGRGSRGERRCLCSANGTEIVRFHGGHEAEVHLTRPLIARLQPVLRRSSAVILSRTSGWVTVRLEVSSDIDLLATLVSAALLGAQRQGTPTPAPVPPAPCGHEEHDQRHL
ncbi:DUF5519 family protein [Streptomyces sp. Go40/10]|uniref:luciferase domain-containing protein n=1 Tax=Streptomyces sp. Go40/10 TaxID=2825844 RepID=UPI001E59BC10|nr:luciferase family protein [Streptomyces sp. Go40/10]UFR06857.1 DUF5519 family protein [Streptomyces sp. Go40/10]